MVCSFTGRKKIINHFFGSSLFLGEREITLEKNGLKAFASGHEKGVLLPVLPAVLTRAVCHCRREKGKRLGRFLVHLTAAASELVSLRPRPGRVLEGRLPATVPRLSPTGFEFIINNFYHSLRPLKNRLCIILTNVSVLLV